MQTSRAPAPLALPSGILAYACLDSMATPLLSSHAHTARPRTQPARLCRTLRGRVCAHDEALIHERSRARRAGVPGSASAARSTPAPAVPAGAPVTHSVSDGARAARVLETARRQSRSRWGQRWCPRALLSSSVTLARPRASNHAHHCRPCGARGYGHGLVPQPLLRVSKAAREGPAPRRGERLGPVNRSLRWLRRPPPAAPLRSATGPSRPATCLQ